MPREIYKEPNVPESENDRNLREQESIASFRKHYESFILKAGYASKEEIDAAREAFLASVDFKRLREIFSNVYRRSGFPVESMNFVDQERVFLGMAGGIGMYSGKNNDITLFPYNLPPNAQANTNTGWGRLFRDLRDKVEYSYGNVAMQMITILIHEETHAVSRNICIGPRKFNFASDYSQSGFSRHADAGSRKWKEKDIPTFRDEPIAHASSGGEIFDMLNEGVIEKLAQQVTDEYLAQSGWKQADVATYQGNKKNHPEKLAYPEEVALIDFIVAKIAQSVGIPKETVFQALIRGAMEGETFANEEVQELFSETFDDDFLKKMSKLQDSSFPGDKTAIDLINQYSRKPDLES